jgi:hypothetical protein
MVEIARNAITLAAQCCFVVGKVLSLRRHADNTHLSAWPPLGWAG